MRAASSSPSKRGRVPAIGRVCAWPACTDTSRSGEELTTWRPCALNRPANGAGLARRSCAYSACGLTGAANCAPQRRDRFTWNTSPARRYSITRRTTSVKRCGASSPTDCGGCQPCPASGNAAEASATSASSNTCSPASAMTRSEEHTSELQSQSNLVCRLLLEKKKKKEKRVQQ